MARLAYAQGVRFLFFCGTILLVSAGLFLPTAHAVTFTTTGCGGCASCVGPTPCVGACTTAAGGQCGANCGCNDSTGSCACNHPV